MTSYILLNAAVFRAPERKVSKGGKSYVAATLKESIGSEGARWWHALTFSETVGAELLELSDGDAAAFRGTFKAETFDHGGETRVSLTIFVESILPLKAPPRKPKEKAAPPAPRQRPEPQRIGGMRAYAGERDDALDDDIGF